jgi:hypothetical protein
MFFASELRYTGFEVVICSYDADHIIRWSPGEGQYNKNLFCTYFLNGRVTELDNYEKVITDFAGEYCLNWCTAWDFPTREMVTAGSTWLCFSTHLPLTATPLLVNGEVKVPANVGAYIVLGSVQFEDKTARSLNYIKPRDHEITIKGNAKVLLIERGETFVNRPFGV